MVLFNLNNSLILNSLFLLAPITFIKTLLGTEYISGQPPFQLGKGGWPLKNAFLCILSDDRRNFRCEDASFVFLVLC